MSTSTINAAVTIDGVSTRPHTKPRGQVTFRHLLRSEWTKFWSLRSTRWSLIGAALLMLSSIIVTAIDLHTHPLPHGFNSIDDGVVGFHFAELPMAVLGVLMISGEYATGMIRSTFMAAPARLPVLWAKLAVLMSVAFAAILPFAFISFYGAQAVVHSKGLDHSILDHNALRVVIGSAVAVTGLGALGTAFGALTRNTAGGISAVVAVLFLLPVIASLLGSSVANSINQFLPAHAIDAFAANIPDPHMLSPWAGLAVFCGYVVALLSIAAIRLHRRDV
ncbi:MAG: ABC transporter permease [Solirubrobacteraceae bacterium]